LEDGARGIGHQFGVEAFKEADADLVGRELNVVADVDARNFMWPQRGGKN
jgi:hypothetical protein